MRNDLPKSPRPDARRRALLKRLGLMAGMAYAAPALTGLGRARASGPDGGGEWSRPSRPSRPVRQTRRVPPPEIVALLPQGQNRAPIEAAGFTILAVTPLLALSADLFRLRVPGGQSGEQALATLRQLVPAALSDLNHLYRPDDFTCDGPECAAQAAIGWSPASLDAAPRIGMIDTGINAAHHALEGQNLTVHQVDLAERDAPGRQHGTAIAALLVGRAGDRVPGLLPKAELVAVEAFHRGNLGDQADAFSVVAALDRLSTEGVQVINLSFSGPENAVLGRIVRRVLHQGVALVAAAGNDGPGAPPAFPAAWPGVIAVTAVDTRMNPYRQASTGAHVSLAAPGVNLWTAASVSGGRLRSGTSYAAPFVTAVLALERFHAPDASLAELIARMHACARDLGAPGFDSVFGHGLVRAPEACNAGADTFFTLSGE